MLKAALDNQDSLEQVRNVKVQNNRTWSYELISWTIDWLTEGLKDRLSDWHHSRMKAD